MASVTIPSKGKKTGEKKNTSANKSFCVRVVNKLEEKAAESMQPLQTEKEI